MGGFTMSIDIFGNNIKAKTEGSLINLNDLFRVGNITRMQLGKAALQMNPFLNSKGTKEYVAAAAKVWNKDPEELIQKKGRGRNAKALVHISIALLAAEQLNPEFHAQMHKSVVEGKLFEFRECGATEFKKLNVCIDTYLPDSNPEGNKSFYIRSAIAIRCKVLGVESKLGDWNKADAEQTYNRFEIEKDLCKMLRLGMINNIDHLIEVINQL